MPLLHVGGHRLRIHQGRVARPAQLPMEDGWDNRQRWTGSRYRIRRLPTDLQPALECSLPSSTTKYGLPLEDKMGANLGRRLLRHLWKGLNYTAYAAAWMPPVPLRVYPDAEQDVATTPTPSLPPAHPERLVPDEPISAEAASLWMQLSDLGKPPR
ncbi:hypothetical protein GCM10009780_52680 [Actinomadura alba]